MRAWVVAAALLLSACSGSVEVSSKPVEASDESLSRDAYISNQVEQEMFKSCLIHGIGRWKGDALIRRCLDIIGRARPFIQDSGQSANGG